MRALLDVNVLIALLDADHSMHGPAIGWFARNANLGWASCPITQNGCIRVMSGASYINPLPVSLIAQRLADAAADKVHAFWPDDITILDAAAIDVSMIHGPKQLTDVYLLALAVRHRARLVTFDQGIALGAVSGATPRNLLRL